MSRKPAISAQSPGSVVPRVDLFPPIAPYETGMLPVSDGNSVYWETCGNPDGKPALIVHGGPGTGCADRMRQAFDPSKYRIILFDQRGAGRSIPHASEASADMSSNTTHHVLADMEALRRHLHVDRWLLSGGSWGTTLALAYAERYPQRVSKLVLSNVTLSRKRDIDWLYRGVARFFPEEWREFRAGVPPEEQSDLVSAYARLMEDVVTRDDASNRWAAWEDAVLSLEPNAQTRTYAGKPTREQIAFVRICAHYFSHAAWLEDNELLRGASRLLGIPGVIIHGRLDLSCPIAGAWELAQVWTDSEFHAVPDMGHRANASMRALMLRAHEQFSS